MEWSFSHLFLISCSVAPSIVVDFTMNRERRFYIANKSNHPRKQFCPRGHDTFVVGRYLDGQCTECSKRSARSKLPKNQLEVKHRKQFCLRGHDTSVLGRSDGGRCNQCKREYYANRHGLKPKNSQGQFLLCPRGHNKDVVGRTSRGRCTRCSYEESWRRQGILSIVGGAFTVDHYNKMLTTQEHRCLLCQSLDQDLEARLVPDHNHKTGKVRALLCRDCNHHAGFIEWCRPRLLRMLSYLDQFDTR